MIPYIDDKVKYTDRNVGQCWNCKNCVGEISVTKNHGFLSEYVIVLPECRVTEMYMTYVNHEKCEYFEVKQTEARGKSDEDAT